MLCVQSVLMYRWWIAYRQEGKNGISSLVIRAVQTLIIVLSDCGQGIFFHFNWPYCRITSTSNDQKWTKTESSNWINRFDRWVGYSHRYLSLKSSQCEFAIRITWLIQTNEIDSVAWTVIFKEFPSGVYSCVVPSVTKVPNGFPSIDDTHTMSADTSFYYVQNYRRNYPYALWTSYEVNAISSIANVLLTRHVCVFFLIENWFCLFTRRTHNNSPSESAKWRGFCTKRSKGLAVNRSVSNTKRPHQERCDI